jgi:hypothetical protein
MCKITYNLFHDLQEPRCRASALGLHFGHNADGCTGISSEIYSVWNLLVRDEYSHKHCRDVLGRFNYKCRHVSMCVFIYMWVCARAPELIPCLCSGAERDLCFTLCMATASILLSTYRVNAKPLTKDHAPAPYYNTTHFVLLVRGGSSRHHSWLCIFYKAGAF